MIVTCEPGITIESMALHKSGEDRSPGLHLSDVIKSIMVDIDPKTYASGKPMNMASVEVGFSFEVMLEQAFVARRMDIVRIGEVEKDGILMSPDGLDAGDPPTLEEFKSTKKSCRETPWPCDLHADIHEDCRYCRKEFGPKFLSWLLQIKSYCYALGVTHARLRALFLDGDYGENRMPLLRTWGMVFTQRELDEHWRYILRQARSKGLLPKEAA